MARTTTQSSSSAKPRVAIIGRPNVGKSTLFNRLVGRRQALVHDQPGVTRDRLYADVDWESLAFTLIDTGGMVQGGSALDSAVTAQSLTAVEEADLVLCVLDGREGLSTLDHDVIQNLRKANVPTLYVLNKVDHEERVDDAIAQVAEAGVAPLYPISAEHGRQIDTLLDAIRERLSGAAATQAAERAAAVVRSAATELSDEDRDDDDATESTNAAAFDENDETATVPIISAITHLRVAIIGRPNAGKSTLVNYLAGAERVVASEIPGTTRDVIDVDIVTHDRTLTLLDTAGIRRRARVSSAVEIFSVMKALQTMERADVVVMLCDAIEGISHQDRALLTQSLERGRPTILFLNKWDLVNAAQTHKINVAEAMRETLGEAGRVPILCGSAKTGDGMVRLQETMWRYGTAAHQRFSTSALNRVVEKLMDAHHIPSFRGHHVKISYATQVNTAPPTVVAFTNFPQGIPESYQRYMRKALEEKFGAPGLPIRLSFRKKK